MSKDTFVISRKTDVHTDNMANPVLKNAVDILQRDIQKATTGEADANQITLVLKKDADQKVPDTFTMHYVSPRKVEIVAATTRGLMYGALAVSREVLGIDDFWYFMDTPIKKQSTVNWTDFSQHLPDFQTKYRGWFVNDELLVAAWQDHDSKDYVWDRIYETLLRVGGNLVVPGTDKESRYHRNGARDMGLIIAHHHAEPLGSEMFARVYPTLEASYLKYPELFKKLWRDSILEQRGHEVVYGLGFRGQGDRPFWLDDASHQWTDEEKAKVINDTIKLQYDMVQELDPGAQCSVSIYGELTGLFNKGLLKLPQDVIEIWADNGYGKMVSRRQWDDDPRSPVLTIPNKAHRARGIYYHVTFHDLQASSFLTLLPNSPHFVAEELEKVRKAKMDTLELINVGNVKPHILFIREVARSWRRDYQVHSEEAIIKDYVSHYYSEAQKEITTIYEDYFKAPIQYGPHDDQKAGDEFATYLIRKVVKAWMGHYPQLEEMKWLTGDVSLDDQLTKVTELIDTKYAEWDRLYRRAVQVYADIMGQQPQRLFYNDMLLGIAVHACSLHALRASIQAYRHYQQAEIVHAFLGADEAVRANDEIIRLRRDNPSPKWVDFFHNDAYSNIELNAIKLRRLRSYLRVLGDGSDEDVWERKYLMEPADARVMLLSNTHLALSDDQIAKKLREQLIDEK